MTTFPAGSTSALPQEVSSVPEEYRFPETFGWGYAVAGCAMVLLSITLIMQEHPGMPKDYRLH